MTSACTSSPCFYFLPFVLCTRGLDKQTDGGTDRRADNGRHQDERMESDVNTQAAALDFSFWQTSFLLIQFSSCSFSSDFFFVSLLG